MRRVAFTLIEMLVVIAIIAILMALIVGSVGMLQKAAKKQRTNAILTAIAQGLRLAGAEQGGAIAPTPHPFASTAAPRFAFVRATPPHDPIDLGGNGLIGVLPEQVPPGYQGRVLSADDRCSDPAAPLAFGAPRRSLGILSVGLPEVIQHRLLPPLPIGMVIADPDTAGRAISGSDTPAASQRLFDAAFQRSTVLEELGGLGALFTPPDDEVAHLIIAGRLWSATAAGISIVSTSRVMSGGSAHSYRLRGLALYDAWGNEIFYDVAGDGRTQRLVSAGADGVLQWHPGDDGLYQTVAAAADSSGDDRDGARDNVIVGAAP